MTGWRGSGDTGNVGGVELGWERRGREPERDEGDREYGVGCREESGEKRVGRQDSSPPGSAHFLHLLFVPGVDEENGFGRTVSSSPSKLSLLTPIHMFLSSPSPGR